MNKKAICLGCLIALLIGALCGGGAMRHYCKKHQDCPAISDTTYVEKILRDTVFIDSPIPVVSKELQDSLKLYVSLYAMQSAVIDSLLDEIGNAPMDTIVEISIPKEQKEYVDTTYHAWVSGYQPSLDSIEVYNRTVYKTVTIHDYPPKKHWGIGVQAGVGIGAADNKIVTTPYIGIGITYTLFSF